MRGRSERRIAVRFLSLVTTWAQEKRPSSFLTILATTRWMPGCLQRAGGSSGADPPIATHEYGVAIVRALHADLYQHFAAHAGGGEHGQVFLFRCGRRRATAAPDHGIGRT